MKRPEYVTCIKQTSDTTKSWCGRNVSMEFTFQNIDHAQQAVAQGSRLTICPECWTTLMDAIDNAQEYLNSFKGVK